MAIRLSAAAIYLGCLGCAHPSIAPLAPPAEGRVATAASDSNAAFPRGQVRQLNGLSLPVDISLPSPEAWQRTEKGGTLKLIHAGSSTSILLRFWATTRLVTADQCEQELRLRSAGSEEQSPAGLLAAVDNRKFEPGADYRGTLTSKVITKPGGPSAGRVHGVAAGLGHCLSIDAATQVAGGAGEEEMAYRLSVLMSTVAAHVRLRQVESRFETTRTAVPKFNPPAATVTP